MIAFEPVLAVDMVRGIVSGLELEADMVLVSAVLAFWFAPLDRHKVVWFELVRRGFGKDQQGSDLNPRRPAEDLSNRLANLPQPQVPHLLNPTEGQHPQP